MASIHFPNGQSRRGTEGRSGEVLARSPNRDHRERSRGCSHSRLHQYRSDVTPKSTRTFDEYFDAIFTPYVLKQLESVGRVDLVWDVYVADSFKRSEREKSG